MERQVRFFAICDDCRPEHAFVDDLRKDRWFLGDAIPHVHYSLIDGPNVRRAEGLPAYFRNFRLSWAAAYSGANAERSDPSDIAGRLGR
jgi:hypothetical protein